MPPRPSSDPTIKVTVNMPASVFMRLRAHADETGSNISELCREAALRTIAEFNGEAAE
jgi:hypothetical protein